MQGSSARGYRTGLSLQVATRPNEAKSETRRPAPTNHQASHHKPDKRRHRGRSWLTIFFLLIVIAALSPFVVVQLINATNESRIYSTVQTVPAKPVAIVFGAGLQRDGTPSWMLADRLNGAVQLYKAGKVQRLLLTGDSVTSREVSAMRTYVLQRGVPAAAIQGDDEGLRTYDSCYRASANFGVSKAILVTQGYHLPRALYLCNSLGVEAVGYKAGRDDYPNQEFYNNREFLATFGSWLDITVIKPAPGSVKNEA